MSDSLKVRALVVEQDAKTLLYSFFLKGKDILKIADISRISKSSSGDLLGYQRGEVLRHINEIVDYLDSDMVLFPNAIILAMSSEVRFKQSRGPSIGDGSSRAGLLEIPVKNEGTKVAWIVDGQQRTMALSKCKRKNLIVPVTAFISDDFQIHRSQFLLVNKVKPLPNNLINELLPEINTALPQSMAKNKIPSALCNILDKDPDSPFRGLICRATTLREEKSSRPIRDTSLIEVIRKSLNNAHGCLYQYRNVATGEIDVESIRKVLNLYWNEVKNLFPEAWGISPKKSRLMGGVGIKSMGILMDRIMCNVHPDDSTASEQVRNALLPLKPHCPWTGGSWTHLNGMPGSSLQNTAGHVNLLSNMLIRIYTGIERQ